MPNPFITLTLVGHNEVKCRINLTQIMSYRQQSSAGSRKKYTYILLGGNALTREVTETPEHIDALISNYYSQG